MDSLDKVVWVYPNSKARFNTNDSDQCANQQNYIFTNTSTIPTGNIKNIRWELGNGKSGSSQIINSYYPSSGSYRILLETTSDSGCLDSFYNLIKVYPKPASAFLVNDSAQCLFQNDYIFTDNSFDSIGVNLYQWNINGEQTQTAKAAKYVFKTPGYKKITLVSTSLRGCRDTISRLVYVKPMPDPVFETLKTFYCEYTGPYSFLPRTAGGTFYGKNIQNNEYNPVILWLDTIKYVVTVNGCTDSSAQNTQVYPGPRVNLGNDTTLCKYEILELKVNSWQSQFVWDNGSTLDSRRVTKPGVYSVKVTNICGQKSDTVVVQYRDINCRFFLPTAFTPNEDGLNDRYKPITYGVDEMEYRIYNRWGEKIYEGVAGDAGWDGTYMGLPVANGTFVITVSYKYDLGYRQVRETAESVFELMR
jgi:gliding motility-associated-like protein